MAPGAVRCALAYPELGGVGIVEEVATAPEGERFGTGLCSLLNLEGPGSVWGGRVANDMQVMGDEWYGKWAMQDPYLAVLVRYDELEMATGKGVTMEDGTHIKMDADERRVMQKNGTMQTGQFMRRTLALHLERKFTDVMATDGSKAGRKAAYGVWEGPAERQVAWGAHETESDRAARVAAGIEGGRLPDGYDVLDAELAAIVAAMERVRQRDVGALGSSRCG